MLEIWIPIEIAPNYEVSNLGRVRRDSIIHNSEILAGYPRANLFINRKSKKVFVHILVAKAFIGSCPDGMQVNHKDGNKTNACASNLEYVTPGDNQRHAYATGLRKHMRGEGHHQSKLTKSAVDEIRTLRKSGIMLKDIAKQFGVHLSTVSYVCANKTWALTEDESVDMSIGTSPAA